MQKSSKTVKQETSNLSKLFEKLKEPLENFFDAHFMEVSDERLKKLLEIRYAKEIIKKINDS